MKVSAILPWFELEMTDGESRSGSGCCGGARQGVESEVV